MLKIQQHPEQFCTNKNCLAKNVNCSLFGKQLFFLVHIHWMFPSQDLCVSSLSWVVRICEPHLIFHISRSSRLSSWLLESLSKLFTSPSGSGYSRRPNLAHPKIKLVLLSLKTLHLKYLLYCWMLLLGSQIKNPGDYLDAFLSSPSFNQSLNSGILSL